MGFNEELTVCLLLIYFMELRLNLKNKQNKQKGLHGQNVCHIY